MCPVKKYDMSSKPKHGIALIIHNNKWNDGSEPRKGSEMDVQRFEMIVKMFRYDYTIETNLEAEKMRAAVARAADKVEDSHDSFICFITSHGNNSGILGVDDEVIMARELVDIVGPDNCKKLANKPKIFVIQACRGDETPTEIMFDKKELAGSYHTQEKASIAIPPMADYLFAFCTTPRAVAMRSSTSGSFYVKVLHDKLKEYSGKLSLDDILLLVHDELATSNHYAYRSEDGVVYRQMGQIVSTMRKKVYFVK